MKKTTDDIRIEKQQYSPKTKSKGLSLSEERKSEILDLAETISETYCSKGLISPEIVAEKKDISISFGDYGDAFDGILEFKNNRFHIFCNANRVGSQDSPRARFTLSHELGHFYIDEHRNALVSGRIHPHLSRCEFESPYLAEQEADYFAAHLLMPTDRFSKSAKNAEKGFTGILKLTEEYQTSITSTAIRYTEINLAPCMIIKWHWQGYVWKRFSNSMFRRKFMKMPKKTEKLPENSATRFALAQKKIPECGYFQSGTLASVWFPYVKQDSILDVILIEEAVPLGKYGALTVLYPQSGCPVFDTA